MKRIILGLAMSVVCFAPAAKAEQQMDSDSASKPAQTETSEKPTNSGQSAESKTNAAVGTAKTSTQPINSALSKFYMEYHDRMLTAKSIDDMLPYLAAKRCADIKGDEKKMPQKDIDFMFSLMKDCCPPKVRVLDEKIDEAAGRAELKLDCPGSQSKIDKAISMLGTNSKEETHGLVRLVKEDGAWKVDKEEWSTSSVIKD